jgi:2-oxoglutarate dehydrogenase E2 component (dihydrolipoamide succinyltransferase)
MADVIMPQMGESIAEGTVTKWLKNVGDRVERDEPLFEISTDKVDAEIPSPAAGVLKEIRVAPGTTVAVNTVVGVIAAEGEAPATAPPVAAEPPTAKVEPTLLTAHATVPAPAAPAAPPVEYRIEGEAPPTALPPEAEDKPRSEMTADELRLTRSSPVVRKIAAEHQLDIREIPGTGIGGRVTKQDILGVIESKAAPAGAPAAQADGTPGTLAPPATPVPAPGTPLSAEPVPAPTATPTPAPAPTTAVAPAPVSRVQVVPMTPIRRKTAEHMLLSRRTSAHVSTVFEVDMTRVAQLRDRHKAAFEERGVKLTYMAFILKAVVEALKAYPVVNASVDGDNIVYHRAINVGLAVALDWGLIVPVVHDADEKNVLGLARAIADLADRARTKKLKIEEVQGGTFTITNPGGFGSLFGTPIINQPQVAILDVGAIEKRPVVRDDAIAIRTMAYLCLTFDHRIVDGADADRFMAHVKKTLQEFDEGGL